MAQTAAVVDALKKALKAHGKTYADVARTLELSQPSVKRLFSEQALSLKRLDAICAMLDMEITDLLQQIAEEGWQLRQLSEAQESEIAADIPLLLVTVAVLNHLDFEEILRRFTIDEHEVIRKLAWLDRQALIELLPGNRIRLKVASNFAWRPDGPIQRFFRQKISSEYFSARFNAPGERLLILNGMLTAAGLEQFHRRMERLAHEFEELAAEDLPRPVDERAGQTVVLAVRPWALSVFEEYLRET
ncbi:MAG: helix-turn-helix domain-containing protein [Gammaproteobacteria bacterium]